MEAPPFQLLQNVVPQTQQLQNRQIPERVVHQRPHVVLVQNQVADVVPPVEIEGLLLDDADVAALAVQPVAPSEGDAGDFEKLRGNVTAGDLFPFERARRSDAVVPEGAHQQRESQGCADPSCHDTERRRKAVKCGAAGNCCNNGFLVGMSGD